MSWLYLILILHLINKYKWDFSWKTRNCLGDPKLLNGRVYLWVKWLLSDRIKNLLRGRKKRSRPRKLLFYPIHTCPFLLDPLFAEYPAILPFLASGSKMQRMGQQKLSCILASVQVSLFLKLFFVFVFVFPVSLSLSLTHTSLYIRGVKLIFTVGHISITSTLKGLQLKHIKV